MSYTKMLARIFRFCAFIGFMIHVFVVSDSYFMYSTTTDFTTESAVEATINNEVPNLAVCVRYTDILDQERLEMLVGEHVPRSDNFVRIAEIQSRLTVQQIFDLTPSANKVISSCFYRNDDGFLLDLHNRSLCQKIFTIERFYFKFSMCYAFRPNPDFSFPLPISRQSLLSPSIYYGVRLAKGFMGMDLFRTSIYYNDFPYASIDFAQKLHRMVDFNRRIPYYRAVTFSYIWIEKVLLPSPYDTACRQIEPCFQSCWERMEDQMNKVYYNRFIPENKYKNLNRKHINFIDLQNDTIRQVIVNETTRCDEECSGQWCRYSFTVTEVDVSRTADKATDKLSIYVKSNMGPGILAHAMPKIDLMTFLIYISNCLEIWMGVHFLTLSKLYKRLEKRIRLRFKLMRKKKRRDVRKKTTRGRNNATGNRIRHEQSV